MIKNLQKQIEAKKQELIRPAKEKFEAVFQGHEIYIDFDMEGTRANLNTNSFENGNVLVLNFEFTLQESLFTSYSFKQEKDGALVISTRPIPFTIDFEVLGFVFYELSQILENLKTEKTEDEDMLNEPIDPTSSEDK